MNFLQKKGFFGQPTKSSIQILELKLSLVMTCNFGSEF